ncbi:MAG: SDR family oxidoreductase, partial [Planctomycetes bacterium]|nr:SDR family oxidoreductase [Planctomycetota bacterium]
MNELPFQGRTAVVTGGADGIGRATAVRLALGGARVFTGDIQSRPENVERFAKLGITSIPCDVRSEAQVKQLIETAYAAQDRLDILVNNAGIGLVKQIPDVTEEEWDRCLDTNFKAAFLTAKHAIGPMRSSGGGSIINVSSNAGILPRAHDPVYSTSKGALVALTRSLALCHARDKIRVNAVCPGPVGDTGMMNADLKKAVDPQALADQMIDASPLAKAFRRMITPDEVAEAICY